MKKLESAGLIRRTPHVGTMVVSTGQAKSLNRELSSMSDLDRLASNNPRRILDIRKFVVSCELSPRIGFPPGETLIRFSILKTMESTLSQIRRRRARGTSGLWPSSP